MELVKILKYVEKSFEGKPSFLLLMSDNKEYISNGCVFTENTEENRNYLIAEYHCKEYLKDLLDSNLIENYDHILDASFMFKGSKALTKVKLNLPNVTKLNYMFDRVFGIREVTLKCSKAITAKWMFFDCGCLEKVNIDFPKLEDAAAMFVRCNRLEDIKIDFPNLINAEILFADCQYLKRVELTASKNIRKLSIVLSLKKIILRLTSH